MSREYTKEEVEAMLRSYLVDPYNTVNVSLATLVNMSIPLVGSKGVITLLAGYLGVAVGNLASKGNLELDDALELTEALHMDIRRTVEEVYLTGTATSTTEDTVSAEDILKHMQEENISEPAETEDDEGDLPPTSTSGGTGSLH